MNATQAIKAIIAAIAIVTLVATGEGARRPKLVNHTNRTEITA